MKTRRAGFTLVETLVSLGILAILSTVILMIVFIVLRSSDKVEKTKLIKQNGEIVISVMTDFIRQAELINCLGDRIEVKVKGGSTVFSRQYDDEGKTWRIASNSAYLTSGEVSCEDNLEFSCGEVGNSLTLVNFTFDLSSGDQLNSFRGRALQLYR